MNTYPPKEEQTRIAQYKQNESIFLGEHYEAFKTLLPDFLKNQDPIKYLAINFGKLLSVLTADMLFEEFPKISTTDDKYNEYIEKVIADNDLKTQLYESAVEGSYRGDALFRIRSENDILIIEDINPANWVAKYNRGNVREEPKEHVLFWEVELGGLTDATGKPQKAVYKEIHTKGKIITELWKLENGMLTTTVDLKAYYPDVEPEIDTKIKDFLIVHIPNFKINSLYYGLSDYKDLLPLFYAINNRLSRTDNILDKHGDPILAVPDGTLDEEGGVRREKFGVIEIESDGNGSAIMPQYIVWDAKLESAFSEIDRLVEFVLMLSESSRTALGIEKDGVAGVESGKALKYKLLRTIAKTHRKQNYYTSGIKRLLSVATDFAKANNLKTKDGTTYKGEVMPVNIEWQDGILLDLTEQLDIEEKRLDLGLTTKEDSVARLDGITVEEAGEKVKKIKEQRQEDAPKFSAFPLRTAPDNTSQQ